MVEKTYDNSGKLLTQCMKMGENETLDEYHYNRKNRIAEVKKYRNGELTELLAYKLDEDAAICNGKNASGDVNRITTSTYDKWDNILSQEVQDRAGNVIRTSWYAYVGEDGIRTGMIPK